MKNEIRYLIGATLASLSLVACSPEEFEGASESGLPTVEGYSISVDTDQETNTATFTANGNLTGCHAVWYLDGAPYSILNSASYHSMTAGTHAIELKIMNRNGISRNGATSSFTFNETKVDYTPYFTRLTGKTWRVDYTEKGHMGCGESGSDGSNWWPAGVNDKADWGVYDDRLTFSHTDADGANGGTYTYDPGEGGTVYVNTSITSEPFGSYNTNDETDYMVPVNPMTSTFELVPGTYNGESCIYIQFAPHTLLPYIPNIETYENPLYRIEALTSNRLAIVCDNGSIAWRMVLTAKEDTGLPDEEEQPAAVMDWNYEASSNLWLPVDAGDAFLSVTPWFANDGWEQISDPAWTHEGNTWELDIPEGMGTSQWQGQFPINTTLSASASKAYNFYCTIDADNDCPGVTIKLTDGNSDDNFLCADRHVITGGKQFVYKLEGKKLPVGDAENMKLFFDFGGTPAGTHVKISNIYLEEAISYGDESNLWAPVDANQSYTMSFWWADENWGQVADPTFAVSDNEDGSKIYTFTSGVTNASEWQAQNAFNTDIAVAATDVIYFSCNLTCNEDARATVKCCQTDDDDNALFYDGSISLKGGETKTIKFSGVKLSKETDAPAIKLIFDFGGTMEGNVYTVTDIILAKM